MEENILHINWKHAQFKSTNPLQAKDTIITHT